MAISMAQSTHDPAYTPFLGVAVGEDETGANVSVLSRLARPHVEPLTEATDLAHMQDAAARQRLQGLLSWFTDVKTLASGKDSIAATLLALLPYHSNTARLSAKTKADPLMLLPAATQLFWMVGEVAFIGWIASLAQGNSQNSKRLERRQPSRILLMKDVLNDH